MISPTKILVVEDDAAERRLVVRSLEKGLNDIEINEEDSRDGLLELLKERDFHVVVTDYKLIGLTGLDVIDMVREASVATPIIMLTGTGTEKIAIEAMRRGVADYVIKSTEHIRRLPATVEHVLKSAERELARDRAEAALWESEERNRLILDTVSDGSRDWNIVTGQVHFSDGWIKSLGYTRGEVTPDIISWQNRIHPDDINRVLAAMEAHLRGDTPEFKIEYRLRRNTGDYRPNLDQGMVVSRGENGKPLRMVGTDTDITELARAREHEHELEEQLRQAQKMEAVGTLAGGIAHDFNNILHAILGYSKLAQENVSGDAEILAECLEEIEAGGRRAEALVKQILTFSRKAETEMKPLKLQPLIEEALRFIRSTMPTTIRIEPRIDLSCAQVKADATQIHQVLTNLCTNAMQAMDDGGGILRVSLDPAFLDFPSETRSGRIEPGEYIQLSVTDTGIGIDPASLQHVFDPFYTTKDVGKGTGLGMAVVHGIVVSMGGGLTIESELGVGTTVRILLPALQKDGVSEQPQVPPQPLSRGSGHVMIVDDEASITELTRLLLESRGFTVDVFNDVAEALKAAEDNSIKFDVALLDYTMPEKTGIELARDFEALIPDMPVILATGQIDKSEIELLDSPNIVDVVKKPFDVDVLIAAINRTLNRL